MAKKKEEITEKALLIAYNIRMIRGKQYETIKQASDGFGVNPSHWSQWETGIVTPFKSTMGKLAKFFKVEVGTFCAEPERWQEIRVDFIKELRSKARTQKDCYPTVNEIVPDDNPTPATPRKESAAGNDDALTIFLEIYGLINSARKKVDEGVMDVATYDRHMKNLNDIIEASMYGK